MNNADSPTATNSDALSFFHDVDLTVSAEFGRAELTIRRLLGLKEGSVVELDKFNGEPIDIRANGRVVARGEVVVVNENFGIRVTEIVDAEGLSLTAAE